MYDLLLLIFAGLLVYMAYRFSRNRPELFSPKALTAAIGTFGALAIFLIAVVWFSVTILRNL